MANMEGETSMQVDESGNLADVAKGSEAAAIDILCSLAEKKKRDGSNLNIEKAPNPTETNDMSFVCVLKLNKCPMCDKQFEKKSTLTAHLITHFGENNLPGPSSIPEAYKEVLKEKKTSKKVKKKEKSKKVNPKTKPNTKKKMADSPLKCKSCNKSFKSKKLLDKHKVRNKTMTSQMCKFCMKMFTRKCQLTRHMNKGRLNPPKKCNQCEEKFFASCLMKKHSLKHDVQRKNDQNERLANWVSKACNEPATFITSIVGKPKLVDADGHMYLRKRVCFDRITWSCEKRMPVCYARVDTVGSTITRKSGSHNHDLDKEKHKLEGAIVQMKERSLKTQETENDIVVNVIKSLPEDVVKILPDPARLRRLLRYHRRRNGIKVEVTRGRTPQVVPKVSKRRALQEQIETNISQKILENKDLNKEINNLDSFPAVYIKGVQGELKLVDPEGYIYVSSNQEGQDHITWTCEQNNYCKATAQTVEGKLVELSQNHTHSTDIGRVLIVETVKRMKHRAMSSDDDINQIITTEYRNYAENALSLLPDKNILNETLSKIRQKREEAKVQAELDSLGVDVIPASYVQSRLGNRKLVDPNGYTYQLKHVKRASLRCRWKCDNRDKCRATAVTLHDNIIKLNGEHTHPPTNEKIDVFRAISRMKDRVISSNEPLNDIIISEKAQLSKDTLVRLPNQEKLFKILKRARSSRAQIAAHLNMKQIFGDSNETRTQVPVLQQHQQQLPQQQQQQQQLQQTNPPPAVVTDLMNTASEQLPQQPQDIVVDQDLLEKNMAEGTYIYIIEQSEDGIEENLLANLEVQQPGQNAQPVLDLETLNEIGTSTVAPEAGEDTWPATFISNENDSNPYLVDPSGYIYTYQMIRRSKSRWKCDEPACEAKAHTIRERIVDLINDHNHAVDYNRLTRLKVIAQISHRVKTTCDPLEQIIESEIRHLPHEVTSGMPDKSELVDRFTLSRQRMAITLGRFQDLKPKKKKIRERVSGGGEQLSVLEDSNRDIVSLQNVNHAIQLELKELLPLSAKFENTEGSSNVRKLVDPAGYVYVYKKDWAPKVQWMCSQSHASCTVHATTYADNIVGIAGIHNHTSDISPSHMLQAVLNMKNEAIETEENIDNIIKKHSAELDDEAIRIMPKSKVLIAWLLKRRDQIKKRRQLAENHNENQTSNNKDVHKREVLYQARFVNGRNRNKKLVDPDGYMYQLRKSCGNKVYWVCERQPKCPARCQTLGEMIITFIDHHTHDVEVGKVEALDALDRMKIAAKHTQDDFRAIINREARFLNDEQAAWLPHMESMIRTLQRIRTKMDMGMQLEETEVPQNDPLAEIDQSETQNSSEIYDHIHYCKTGKLQNNAEEDSSQIGPVATLIEENIIQVVEPEPIYNDGNTISVVVETSE